MTDGRKKTDDETPAPDSGPSAINWRLSEDDAALVAEVRRLTGIAGNADLLRYCMTSARDTLKRERGL